MIGDPLTLEQLRGMDGKPVWVTPAGFWALVIAKRGQRVQLPTHIDREALEDCPVCGKYKVITFKGYRTKEEAIDMSGKSHPHISGAASFCPRCGKSIVSGAGAERKEI